MYDDDYDDDYDYDDGGYGWEDDAYALASAGHGTDEDYGLIGGDSDLWGEY
jgi:hypothetical protein